VQCIIFSAGTSGVPSGGKSGGNSGGSSIEASGGSFSGNQVNPYQG